MDDRDLAVLRGILEKASVDDAKRSAVEQKIGDFYGSCMDEPAIDKLGAGPLEPELKRIDAIKSKEQILDALVRLQLMGVGVFFSLSSEPDPKNSNLMIAQADQGGLGLLDREMCIRDRRLSVTFWTLSGCFGGCPCDQTRHNPARAKPTPLKRIRVDALMDIFKAVYVFLDGTRSVEKQ